MPDTEQITSKNIPPMLNGEMSADFMERMRNLQENNTIVKFLLNQNQLAYREYISPDAALGRMKYRSKHPTEFAVFKCMDGRLNLATSTGTPVGIIQPFRNIGGKFDLGWGNFGHMVNGWVKYSMKKNRNCVPIITYHFSKKSRHGGCAGHGYNTAEAIIEAKKLLEQFRLAFGEERKNVHPILVGIETEADALIFHGDDGSTFDMSKHFSMSEGQILEALSGLYPSMNDEMRTDLAQLVLGNAKHVGKLNINPRDPIDNDHRERIIAVGRGFDWLHVPNQALIIGPYGYEIHDSIATAGNVILGNFEKRQSISKEDGFVVIISSLYFKEGTDRILAEDKAMSIYRLTKKTLTERNSDLMSKYPVEFVVGVTSHDTRKFVPIDHERPEYKPVLSQEEEELIRVEEEKGVLA